MSNIDDKEQQNQQKIINTLSSNNNTLTLLELKQASQLANLYFFKALDQLEDQNRIDITKKDGISWILLLDYNNRSIK